MTKSSRREEILTIDISNFRNVYFYFFQQSKTKDAIIFYFWKYIYIIKLKKNFNVLYFKSKIAKI